VPLGRDQTGARWRVAFPLLSTSAPCAVFAPERADAGELHSVSRGRRRSRSPLWVALGRFTLSEAGARPLASRPPRYSCRANARTAVILGWSPFSDRVVRLALPSKKHGGNRSPDKRVFNPFCNSTSSCATLRHTTDSRVGSHSHSGKMAPFDVTSPAACTAIILASSGVSSS
jgi:hypothetical protein